MTKPELPTFTNIAPMFIQQYERYLPTAFDGSLSLLQKVNKIIQYINENSDYINGLIPQWNEIMDWVMNEGLSESVQGKLDELIADGTIQNLLWGFTTSEVYIYVDSVNGVDAPFNGMIDKPYKTIQYACDHMPKVINKDYYINMEDGFYDEDVKLHGISGSAVTFQRKNGEIDAINQSTGLFVRSITAYDCNCRVVVNNFEQYNVAGLTADAFIRMSRVTYATIHGVRADKTGMTKETITFDGSTGSVNSSFFNSQNYCVVSRNGSNVRVDNTNAHGSSPSGTGILSEAANVFLNGPNAWVDGAVTWPYKCSNAIAQSMGGRINYSKLTYELSDKLLNGWTPYDDASTNAPRAIKVNGFVYLQGLIKGGQVGQGFAAFQLPPLWTPQDNNRYYHPYGSDGLATKIVVDVSGSVEVQVSTGQYISLSDIPGFYVGE